MARESPAIQGLSPAGIWYARAPGGTSVPPPTAHEPSHQARTRGVMTWGLTASRNPGPAPDPAVCGRILVLGERLAFDVDVREETIEHSRELPRSVSEQREEGGDEGHADEEGVDEDAEDPTGLSWRASALSREG